MILRHLPIRPQFILLAVVTILVVVTGILVFYSSVAEVMVQKNVEYVDDIFEQVRESIYLTCDTFARLLRTVAFNPTVQGYMLSDDPAEEFALNQDMRRFMAQIVAFASGILDVAVLPLRSAPQSMAGSASSLATGRIDLDKYETATFTGLVEFGLLSEDRRQPAVVVATSTRSLLADNEYGTALGSVALVIDARAIVPGRVSDDGTMSTQFYVLDRNGALLAGEGSVQVPAGELRSGSWQTKIGRESYYVQSAEIANLGGRVVAVTPQEQLLGDVRGVRNAMLVVLLAAAAALTLPFGLLIRNISAPIVQLTSFIARAKDADPRSFPERLSVRGSSEIDMMMREFNSMLDQISVLTGRLLDANARAYEAELVKRDTEMSMLQSQINPHFLYNTLESISGMATAAGADNVVEMTRSLSHIFKYAIKASEEVPFAEEIAMLRSYVRIQELRFGDRVRVRYEIAREATGCVVPKMILQPLVENAITHGLETQKHGGTVSILAEVSAEGELAISVIDDGVGMSAARLRDVRAELDGEGARENPSMGRPVGLKNVHDRIRILYGVERGVSVESRAGHGCAVRLRFPGKSVIHV